MNTQTTPAAAAAATEALPFDDVNTSHGLSAGEQAELADLSKAEGGSKPDVDPAVAEAAAAAEAKAAEEAKAATDAETAKATAIAAEADAVKQAEADAAAAEQARQAALAAIPKPTVQVLPDAPKDFAAEKKTLREEYDNNGLELDEYERRRDALIIEEATHAARRSAIETANQTAQANYAAQVAAADPSTFENVQQRWLRDNGAFVDNPLRWDAMQRAVIAIDTQTGGKLSPAELIARAEKVAFDAFNWQKPAPTTTTTTKEPTAAELQAKLKERQPDLSNVPQTLATVPAAGNDATNFTDLDSADIQTLERSVAHMSGPELEKWLRSE